MQEESHREVTPWQAVRDAAVQHHIDAENRHDLVALIATFFRPSYELVALDSAAIGATAVADLLRRFITAFPDLHTTVSALYHAEAAVIVEGQWGGTQTGPWLGLPASDRAISLPFVAIFKFDEDRLLAKKVYFDSGLLMRQLTNE